MVLRGSCSGSFGRRADVPAQHWQSRYSRVCPLRHPQNGRRATCGTRMRRLCIRAALFVSSDAHSGKVRGRRSRPCHRRRLPQHQNAACRRHPRSHSHANPYDLAQQGDLDRGHVPPAPALPAARPLLRAPARQRARAPRSATPGASVRWRSTRPRCALGKLALSRRSGVLPDGTPSRSPARRRAAGARHPGRRARRARGAGARAAARPASPRAMPSRRRGADGRRAISVGRGRGRRQPTPPSTATAPIADRPPEPAADARARRHRGYATLGVAARRRAPRRQPGRARHAATCRRCWTRRRTPVLDGLLRELLRPAAPARRSAGRRGWRSRAAAAWPRSPTSCCCRRSTATSRCFAHLRALPLLHPERLYAAVPGAGRRPGDLPRASAAPPRFPTTSTTTWRCFRAGDGRPARSRCRWCWSRRPCRSSCRTASTACAWRSSPTSSCSATRRFVLAVDGADAGRGAARALSDAGQDRPGRAHPRPGQPAAAGRRAAPAAGGAAADPVPRRRQLLRARDAQQRAVAAARERRAAWRCTSPASFPGLELEFWAIRA